MRQCPQCHKPLEVVKVNDHGHYSRCFHHGMLVSLPFLRSFKGAERLCDSIEAQRTLPAPAKIDKRVRCPRCNRLMQVTGLEPGSQIRIDQCAPCQHVWFDVGELEAARNKGELNHLFPSLSQEPMRAVAPGPKAFFPSERMPDLNPPNMSIPMLFGLPGEDEKVVPRSLPAATLILILMSLYATYRLGHSQLFQAESWLFFPQAPFRDHGLTLIKSLFLHGSWGHLIGNAYFLYMCGDNIEDEKGSLFLLMLFFLAGLGGHVAYMLSHSTIPSLGASGGVSGVIAYYTLAYPHNRISLLKRLPWEILPRVFTVSTQVYFFFWFALQALQAGLQANGLTTGTNYLAHIGGGIIGLIFYLIEGRSSRANPFQT